MNITSLLTQEQLAEAISELLTSSTIPRYTDKSVELAKKFVPIETEEQLCAVENRAIELLGSVLQDYHPRDERETELSVLLAALACWFWARPILLIRFIAIKNPTEAPWTIGLAKRLVHLYG